MCLVNRTLSRKARIFLALGNLFMFTGLTLSRFGSGLSQQIGNLNHFLCGFLLGIGIIFLFAAMYQARRNHRDQF